MPKGEKMKDKEPEDKKQEDKKLPEEEDYDEYVEWTAEEEEEFLRILNSQDKDGFFNG